MNGVDLAERVRGRYPDVVVARGEATVLVEPGSLLEALQAFRDDDELRLDFLSSVSATDWPDREPRFRVVYELASSERRVAVPSASPRTRASCLGSSSRTAEKMPLQPIAGAAPLAKRTWAWFSRSRSRQR